MNLLALVEGGASDGTSTALVTNDAVVFGMLIAILGFVFWSCNSSHPGWKRFYKVVPMLLVCYFLPSLLTLFDSSIRRSLGCTSWPAGTCSRRASCS